ncbi:MAG: hypothetical protein AB7G39_05805 [Alphaproteobacteria bacterium]
MSLIARYLEENGIPTVVMGVARDIVEYCGVPRFLFVNFPLGSPCGEPWNTAQQRDLVSQALDVLETAAGPRTTVVAPVTWSKGVRWMDLIFTEEQPFLQGEALENWERSKEKYREMKQRGEV